MTSPATGRPTDSRAGDFGSWVADHQKQLLGFAQVVTGDAHVAQDVLQDALARVYLRWDVLSGPEHDPLSYTRRVIVNENVRLWRRFRRRESPSEHLPAQSTVDWEPDSTLDLLKSLPGQQRTALAYRFYADLSVAETAERMGCSTGSVKTHTSRGIASLRRTLIIEAGDEAADELSGRLHARPVPEQPGLAAAGVVAGRRIRRNRIVAAVVAVIVVAVPGLAWSFRNQTDQNPGPARTGVPVPSASGTSGSSTPAADPRVLRATFTVPDLNGESSLGSVPVDTVHRSAAQPDSAASFTWTKADGSSTRLEGRYTKLTQVLPFRNGLFAVPASSADEDPSYYSTALSIPLIFDAQGRVTRRTDLQGKQFQAGPDRSIVFQAFSADDPLTPLLGVLDQQGSVRRFPLPIPAKETNDSGYYLSATDRYVFLKSVSGDGTPVPSLRYDFSVTSGPGQPSLIKVASFEMFGVANPPEALVLGSRKQCYRLYDPSTLEAQSPCLPVTDKDSPIFSPRSRYLLVVGFYSTGTARVVDFTTGKTVTTISNYRSTGGRLTDDGLLIFNPNAEDETPDQPALVACDLSNGVCGKAPGADSQIFTPVNDHF